MLDNRKSIYRVAEGTASLFAFIDKLRYYKRIVILVLSSGTHTYMYACECVHTTPAKNVFRKLTGKSVLVFEAPTSNVYEKGSSTNCEMLYVVRCICSDRIWPDLMQYTRQVYHFSVYREKSDDDFGNRRANLNEFRIIENRFSANLWLLALSRMISDPWFTDERRTASRLVSP